MTKPFNLERALAGDSIETKEGDKGLLIDLLNKPSFTGHPVIVSLTCRETGKQYIGFRMIDGRDNEMADSSFDLVMSTPVDNMSNVFDLELATDGHPMETRNGEYSAVYLNKIDNPKPLIFILTDKKTGYQLAVHRQIDGCYDYYSDMDIVMSEKIIKSETLIVYKNIYASHGEAWMSKNDFKTEEDAKIFSDTPHYIKTVKFECEVSHAVNKC